MPLLEETLFYKHCCRNWRGGMSSFLRGSPISSLSLEAIIFHYSLSCVCQAVINYYIRKISLQSPIGALAPVPMVYMPRPSRHGNKWLSDSIVLAIYSPKCPRILQLKIISFLNIPSSFISFTMPVLLKSPPVFYIQRNKFKLAVVVSSFLEFWRSHYLLKSVCCKNSKAANNTWHFIPPHKSPTPMICAVVL